MNRVRIFLFGKFNIESDGSLIPRIEARKAEELQVYLLLNKGQPQARER